MSTEYYLVCPEKKLVLELYKEHQYLATLNSIERCGGYEAFNQTILEDDMVTGKEDLIFTMLNRIVGFLRDCSGCTVYHFDDNHFLDWWNDNFPEERGVPGMSKVYNKEWVVYEY